MRLLAFIAVFLFAASAVHASAATSDLEEEKLLQSARQMREQGELKAAASLIRERLKATGVFRFVRQYEELLARIQFESGDFRGAWQRARSLEQKFEQISKGQNTAAERLGLQLLLADIELAGEFLDRARTRLARALELAQNSPQPIDRVESLVRLARLEEVAEDRALASRRWSQVRAACEGLIARANIRDAEFETYRRASDLLADAHVAQKDFAAAVAALVRLKDSYRPIADDEQRLETIRKIAEIHRQAEDHGEQRATLMEALALLESQREHNIATEGDICREIGDSFQRQSDESTARQDFAAARDQSLAAEKHWREAMQRYSAALKIDAAPGSARLRSPKSAGRPPPTTAHPPPGKAGGLPRGVLGPRESMRLHFQLAATAQLLKDWEQAIAANEKLLADQRRDLDELDPETYRTLTRLGTLFVRFGQESPNKSAKQRACQNAIDHLSEAEAYWRKRRPAKPETYVRTLLFLADAREGSASKGADIAALLAQAGRAIETAEKPVAPSLKLSAYFRQGRSLAAQGKYAAALHAYNRAIAIGETSPALRDEYVLTLLNRAMLFKSQRAFEKALTDCQLAVKLQESTAQDARDLRLFPMYLALAGLHIARAESELGRSVADETGSESVSQSLADGEREAQKALGVLQNDLEGAPAAELWHQLALLNSLRFQLDSNPRDRDRARDYWQRSLRIQERVGSRAMQARSMNHLVELEMAELRGEGERLERDEADYNEAVLQYEKVDDATQRASHPALKDKEIQLDERRIALKDSLKELAEANLESVRILNEHLAYPNLHYRTLCTRAAILRIQARWSAPEERDAITSEAIGRLKQAIALTETPREMAVGGDLARAEFFAHYADAFEQLVELYVRRGDWYAALYIAERARNRTFLDQVRQAGGDIWAQLQAKQPELHAELQQILSEHHEASQAIRAQGEPDQALLRQLAAIRQRYLELEVRIRRALVTGQPLAELQDGEQIHKTLVTPDNVVLYYFTTRKATHLFVLDQAHGIRHFRLGLASGFPLGLGEPAGDVSSGALRRLVHQYVAVINDRDQSIQFLHGGLSVATAAVDRPSTTRGRNVRSLQTWVITPEQAAALTDTLVPPGVRALIKEANPSYVLIAPDGPLHQLPFEALPLDAKGKQYVLDIFPPTAYVPSAQIIAAMSAPQVALGKKSAMLVVGDVDMPDQPVVPALEGVTNAVAMRGHGRLGGAFYKLKYSREECTRVIDALKTRFNGDGLIELTGRRTTEANVRREIFAISQSDRRIACLLFSCHGFAQPEQETAELSGSLVLSPSSSKQSPLDDGFLELHEIHQLPLAGCELAVLSACETISGPERPLESGSTLARSFMAAGARRVVCSHWSVDDQSTAELIRRFFENAKEQSAAPGADINLARALYEARRQIRGSSAGVEQSPIVASTDGDSSESRDYSSPFFWAPFVLVGPAKTETVQLFGSNP